MMFSEKDLYTTAFICTSNDFLRTATVTMTQVFVVCHKGIQFRALIFSYSAECRWQCRASWFEFSSEGSSKSGGTVTTGDFTILSQLKELGCGELTRRPREVHFSGCINESYAFHCTGGDFFVKINRCYSLLDCCHVPLYARMPPFEKPPGFGQIMDVFGSESLIISRLGDY